MRFSPVGFLPHASGAEMFHGSHPGSTIPTTRPPSGNAQGQNPTGTAPSRESKCARNLTSIAKIQDCGFDTNIQELCWEVLHPSIPDTLCNTTLRRRSQTSQYPAVTFLSRTLNSFDDGTLHGLPATSPRATPVTLFKRTRPQHAI